MATGDCDKQFDANAAAFRCGNTHDIETWVDVRGHFSTNRRHPIEVDRHVQSLATSGRGINRVARELEECIRESTRFGDVSGARLGEPGSADGRLRYSANVRLARGRSYAESCLYGFDITYLLRWKLRDQVATRPKVDPSVRPKMPMKRTSMPPDPMSKAK